MVDYSQSVPTISPGENGASHKDASQVDSAGEPILKLSHKAAGAAEAYGRQALETAQKLSGQLRAAEDRIAELEADVQHYREKSERAEEWLRKISMEIEARLTDRGATANVAAGLKHHIELRLPPPTSMADIAYNSLSARVNVHDRLLCVGGGDWANR